MMMVVRYLAARVAKFVGNLLKVLCYPLHSSVPSRLHRGRKVLPDRRAKLALPGRSVWLARRVHRVHKDPSVHRTPSPSAAEPVLRAHLAPSDRKARKARPGHKPRRTQR